MKNKRVFQKNLLARFEKPGEVWVLHFTLANNALRLLHFIASHFTWVFTFSLSIIWCKISGCSCKLRKRKLASKINFQNRPHSISSWVFSLKTRALAEDMLSIYCNESDEIYSFISAPSGWATCSKNLVYAEQLQYLLTGQHS